MPVFICSANTVQRPRPATQTGVFRNPRGLKWYYAFMSRWFWNAGLERRLEIWKSEDGVTWSLSNTVRDYTYEVLHMTVTLYDDGTQLIVYVATGCNDPMQFGEELSYYRVRIPDHLTTPIVGTRQSALVGDDMTFPIIKIDRNGYVHIMWVHNRTWSEKGVGYSYAEPWIMGTTTPYPTDSPSWCSPQQVGTHPDIKHVSRWGEASLVMFGGTGDIGGVVYASRRSDGTQILKGRDIVSYNGSSYTLGTETEITTMPNYGDANYTFEVIRDVDQYAHLIYPHTVTNERVRHKKASAINTVESWDAYTVVDDSNNTVYSITVALSIDRSATPNVLYASYIFSAYQNNVLRWRSSPVDTIDWSDESSVVDDTERLTWLSMSDRDYEQGIYVTYDRWYATLRGRFHEIPLAVPKEVKLNLTVPIRYIKPIVIVKRHEEIVAYRTPYTPYRTERPIQPA